MPTTRALDPREIAVADQMRAEIAASRWKKIRPFVRALEEAGTPTDYTTFYRRVNGAAAMPADVLLASLDLLGLDYLEFLTRAMKRVRKVQPGSELVE